MSRPYPATLNLRKIDAAARDGRVRLVANSQEFAVARWNSAAWVFPSSGLAGGAPIGFEPEVYQP
jgi:hypothetical protein